MSGGEGEGTRVMVPLQIEAAGHPEAVAFKRQAKGRTSDAGLEIVEGAGRMSGGQPAGQGSAWLGRGRLAEEEAHHAAVAGAKGEAAARGQVEPAGMAADLGEHGGEPTAGKALLKNPQRLARSADADDHDPARREAEAIESRPIGQAGFAADRSFHDPKDRAVVLGDEPGENGKAEAGRRTGGASGLAADFMESIPAEPAGQETVEFYDPEGKH